MMITGKKKLLAAALLGLVLLVWAGATAAFFLFQPTLAQWTLIVSVAAVATEGALWAGAVLLGIEAFQRLRARLRLQRAPRP